jgi:hypothetical protein
MNPDRHHEVTTTTKSFKRTLRGCFSVALMRFRKAIGEM